MSCFKGKGISIRKVVAGFYLFIILFSGNSCAAGDMPITLEQVPVNIKDIASIVRGAKFFAGTCMTCHTMKYMAYNKLAQKAGVTLDKMPLKNKEWWLNVRPPDLSLIARERGPNWLYTYFHSFYKDPTRPTGYNNLLMHNSVMTNIFAGLQGVQEKLPEGQVMIPLLNHHKPHYYQALQLVQQGSMSPEEFDQTTRDLVNFLVYAGDPKASKRYAIGYWVLGFLILFFILAYLLKRAYWEDVEK